MSDEDWNTWAAFCFPGTLQLRRKKQSSQDLRWQSAAPKWQLQLYGNIGPKTIFFYSHLYNYVYMGMIFGFTLIYTLLHSIWLLFPLLYFGG